MMMSTSRGDVRMITPGHSALLILQYREDGKKEIVTGASVGTNVVFTWLTTRGDDPMLNKEKMQ